MLHSVNCNAWIGMHGLALDSVVGVAEFGVGWAS